MQDRSAITTFLFTDIESSSQLWERDPAGMRRALADHDAIARNAVQSHGGTVVKMTGDGICAAFQDPIEAVCATVDFQRGLAERNAKSDLTLRSRSGLHVGVAQRRDNDYFGTVINRAARIMDAAHGEQILVSQAVAVLLADHLPDGLGLRNLGAVRLRDLAGAERIYQVVHRLLRQDFPPLRSLETTPNNLPQQVTSFIGRERELAAVRKLLAETRLLTLVGVGGIGKTRLTLQLAAEVAGAYPDGGWLVELGPLHDERLVPQAVASMLGIKEEAGKPVLDALLKSVRDRKLLLVLDNCEHLLSGCAELAKKLLRFAPHVKILASSREPLHVSGETSYPVPTLELPDAHRPIEPPDLSRYEALRLFVDRATAAQPSFRVTEHNVPAIVDICRRLDGIPLAIELAAARVRSLSVELISSRLSDRFRLLTGGDRTAEPRQQTLRACIDWSFDLLADNERTLLRRLAVFAGGWTLDAAEAVGAGAEIAQSDVLDLLTCLIEKSLVNMDAEGERYQFLETVRQYAQERLAEAGETEAVRTLHLAYFVDFAEKARPKLVGPEQHLWLARLDFERENILSSHEWCNHADDGAQLGLRLVYAIKQHFFNRGLLALLYQLCVEALARSNGQQHSLARCRVLQAAGQFDYMMGRYTEAQKYLEQTLEIARKIGDLGRVAAVLHPLGMACLGQGNRQMARKHLEEAVTRGRELGDMRELAGAVNALAQLNRVEGALDAAEPLYRQALAQARELGDREFIAVALLNLAMTSIGYKSDDNARSLLLEAQGIAQEIGSKPAGQSVLEVSAGLAVLRADWERAAQFFGAAEAQAGRTSLRRDPADEAFLAPLIEKAKQRMGGAAFASAEAMGGALTYDEAMRATRSWLEEVC